MPQIDRELEEVWDALRASKGQRDEALVEVRITNLRGIDHLRFPFDYPVSVLAGPNGSGKSTVLFACACAYRVPGRRPGDFAPSRLFPNFITRQEAVRSDSVQETELEYHYLHRGDRRFTTWRRGKSWSRKGDGNAQPERQIYLRTLANLTSPSEIRSILQLGRKQVRTEAISPDLLIFAHRILPWRYHTLDLVSGQSSRDLLFAEIDDGETRYSEFHMSSGGTNHRAYLEGHLSSRERIGPDRRSGHGIAPLYPAAGDARIAAKRPAAEAADHRRLAQSGRPGQRAAGSTNFPGPRRNDRKGSA